MSLGILYVISQDALSAKRVVALSNLARDAAARGHDSKLCALLLHSWNAAAPRPRQQRLAVQAAVCRALGRHAALDEATLKFARQHVVRL